VSRGVSAPAAGQKAIRGRVVVMDAAGTVIADGVVYVSGADIAAVLPAAAPPPAGFEAVEALRTGGTVYPGLIELHNHLSYNCLQLWQVPHLYTNRGQWSGIPDYRRLISGPMQVLGKTPSLVPAIVRFVEAKCVVAGVTTSQGIALYSNAGIERYYRGVVRTVEEPDDPALPAAASRIADVAASGAAAFAAELARDNRLLLHLAEGVDEAARRHFQALRLADGSWAISDHLIGIHSVALTPADIAVFAAHGAAMVWSPLSNLLLYGATADVAAMKAAGVMIGLGSDWSPSGSKNLLGELKAARLVSAHADGGPIFSDRELVEMATSTAARMLGWQAALGSIEAGKRADLIAVAGTSGDPYSGLIAASERDLVLVMIGGVAACGQPHLVEPFTSAPETVRIGGRVRMLNFALAGADPDVALVSLAEARSTLTDALANLPELARALEPAVVGAVPGIVAPEQPPEGPTLVLDEIEHTGHALRMDPPGGVSVLPGDRALAAQPPLSSVLGPLTLDGLTADDDRVFLDTLAGEANLPAYLAPGLAAAYARTSGAARSG
jgi:5-methylthioadenosine/S-adenosylhomocysteine deaminase